MSRLAENARRMATGEEQAAPTGPPPADTAPAAVNGYPAPPLEVDEPEIDAPVADVPAVVAWNRVMREVRAISKGDQFNGGRGGNFAFRGIDRVVDHFGPALRRHGVLVIPHTIEKEYGSVKTSSGGNMRQCDVTITWRIYGPQGDFIEAQTAGEGLDTGGRSTSKAQTVAERVLFLVGGVVPTNDVDPESPNVERGEAEVRSPASYLDEITDPNTGRARLLQIKHELNSTRQANALVTNEIGDQEPIVKMIDRIGLERFGG